MGILTRGNEASSTHFDHHTLSSSSPAALNITITVSCGTGPLRMPLLHLWSDLTPNYSCPAPQTSPAWTWAAGGQHEYRDGHAGTFLKSHESTTPVPGTRVVPGLMMRTTLPYIHGRAQPLLKSCQRVHLHLWDLWHRWQGSMCGSTRPWKWTWLTWLNNSDASQPWMKSTPIAGMDRDQDTRRLSRQIQVQHNSWTDPWLTPWAHQGHLSSPDPVPTWPLTTRLNGEAELLSAGDAFMTSRSWESNTIIKPCNFELLKVWQSLMINTHWPKLAFPWLPFHHDSQRLRSMTAIALVITLLGVQMRVLLQWAQWSTSSPLTSRHTHSFPGRRSGHLPHCHCRSA